jgi:RNase P subunit RPR2
MKCQRCESLMTEGEMMLSGDQVKAKAVSVSHCLNCGRIEYGAVVDNYAIQEENSAPRHLQF